jgi:hypothetical protein
MKPIDGRRSAVAGQRSYSRDQHNIRKEFMDAYGFNVDQIGFEGNSLDPIFDYDALTVLSVKLCRIPDLCVEPATIDRLQGLAQSRVVVMLPGGEMRKTFSTAWVGEEMHDGEPIRDIIQAVQVCKARGFRDGLRIVGFNPVLAHREFVKTGQVLELSPIDPYLKELAEIHLHAQSLDLITASGDGFINRVPYQQRLAKHFNGKTSAKDLTDAERSQWLQLLRGWSKARQVARNREAAARAV